MQMTLGSFFVIKKNTLINGGERGIRTLGTFTRTIDFESTAFNRSAISPYDYSTKKKTK